MYPDRLTDDRSINNEIWQAENISDYH
ncbi:hypothetical protein PM8797T_17474 [Gimesia maris DSM 8797]|nr:hypothetical protein PM8797T_17474 [Gimesia maris DSM 8797]